MSKIKTQEEIIKISKNLRDQAKVVVATNGCFDILHLAHVNLLEKAKKEGDVLIVLLNSDLSIKKFKSPNRPIFPENERARILAAFESVDYVTIFDEDDPLYLYKKIKPNKIAKGGTYIPDKVEQHKKLLEKYGGEFVHFPLEQGYSSTKFINKIVNIEKERYKSN